MTQGIYAVNATRFTSEPIMLTDDIRDERVIEDLFHVIAKGDEEWYLMIHEENIEFYLNKKGDLQYREEYENANMIDSRVEDIASQLNITKDEAMRVTWVW